LVRIRPNRISSLGVAEAGGTRRRPKREAGERPARSRHCDRGANPSDATGPVRPGKVRGSAALAIPRAPTGSQETYPEAVRPRSSRREEAVARDGLSLRREPGAPFVFGGGRDRKELAMKGLDRRRSLGVWRWIPAIVMLATSACATGGAVRAASQSARPSGPALFPVTLTDDDGVRVTIPAMPGRIVTFAPSNTEIVFALGLGSRLVGVSGKFDDYPPQATTVQEVGGAGEFGDQPNVETVVALRPDLMLTISGGDQWKQRLRDVGIAVFTVNATDFADLLRDIRTVGRVTGVPQRAAALTGQMAARAAAVQAQVAKDTRVSCFFEAYYPPLTSVGPRTFIFDLLRRAGCDPVSAEAKSDYPEWSVDQLVAEGPDVYLVASESGVSPSAVAKRPGFGAITAVRNGRIALIDSDLVSRPGPRVVQGLEELARALHPGVVP